MNVHIYCDSRYPVYELNFVPSCFAKSIEISREFYEEILSVSAAYEAIQNKLADLAREENSASVPEPKITQAEIDTIKASTPIEDERSIQAALDAFNARVKAA
jgi:hypothetical protein